MKKYEKYNDGLTEQDVSDLLHGLGEEITPDFDIRKVNTHKYEFNINNLNYEVDIVESVMMSTNKKIIDIKFKLMNNPSSPKRNNFATQYQYDIAVKKSQVGITGTGNSQKVFKKVLGSIVSSLREIDPDYITFVADPKRESLYTKFVGLFQKYTPSNYKLIPVNPLTGEEVSNEEFWMEKYNK